VPPTNASTNVLRQSQFVPPPPPRQSAPGFEILRELGRGGMGVVYKARQTALNRIVALKMVLSGSESLESDRLRFLAEAEAVAAVRHPNVVQVYEFGVSNGLPYFAMEFLGGGSLAGMLAEHGRMSAMATARIVEQVARGVQATHDVGVVHRDLKPANILFAGGDRGLDLGGKTTPSAGGGATLSPDACLLTPVVTDFGLAKRGGGYDLTQTGIVMGTPGYMAPEQARGQNKYVSPAADVYALGVVIYECLAGRPPFVGDDPAVVMTRVVTDDPTPVRRFAPNVPRDLGLICHRCLEKEPARRYPSAAALADDLGRFLNGEPVSVRPAGMLEKVVKWIRRYPSRAALYGLTLLVSALIGLSAGVVNMWRNAESRRHFTADALNFVQGEREKADRAKEIADVEQTKAEQAAGEAFRQKGEAERQKGEADRARDGEVRARAARSVDLAFREYDLGNLTQARRYLDECPPHLRPWEWRYVDRLCRTERRTIPTGAVGVFDVAFAPDTGTLLTAASNGVREWDPLTGAELRALPGGALRLAVSGDGRRVAALGQKSVTVFDRPSGKPLTAFAGGGLFVALNRDGSTMLIGDNKRAAIRNVAAATELTIALGDFTAWCGAFSADGEWAAVGGQGVAPRSPASTKTGLVKVVPTSGKGTGIGLVLGSGVVVRAVAFDPAGERLAAGCEDGSVTVWDLATQKPTGQVRVPTGMVTGLAFSPDGKRLAACSADRTARVWDVESGEEVFVFKGHTHALLGVAFSPDGKWLATGSLDATARVWDATAPPDALRLVGLKGKMDRLNEDAVAITMTEDRTRVVVAGGGPTPLQVFDARTGELVWDAAEPAGGTLTTVVISPDGKRVTAADETGAVREWDLETGKLLATRPASGLKRPVRLSADLSRAVGWDDKDGTVTVFDARGKNVLSRTAGHLGRQHRPAISPDGRRVLTAEGDRTGRVWDAETGRELVALSGHLWWIREAAFSPDGTRIATAGTEGWVKVWDAADGRQVLTFTGRNRTQVTVGFSQNGSKLLSLDGLGTVTVHDAGAANP
jgi:WD40 repeat protein